MVEEGIVTTNIKVDCAGKRACCRLHVTWKSIVYFVASDLSESVLITGRKNPVCPI
jgi:hypothetical protein